MKECRFYKKNKDGSVKCKACNHFCVIKPSKVGICGIRKNVDGQLQLLTYGKVVAVNVDSVEKKPLFHFLPGTYTYSFGTLGCNFRCANCQNFDISQIYGKKGDVSSYEEISWGIELSPEEIVRRALDAGCKSISYTYIEPTIFVEFALDTMKLAKEAGLKNIWVSNGFMSATTLDAILPYLDAINVDIKSFDEKFYRENCGASLAPVLENCRRLAEEDVWVEVTTLVIPTLSDDNEMIGKIAHFIASEMGVYVPWHISAFSGEISWKLRDLPSTPTEKLWMAYNLGKKEGLKNVYLGNVETKEGETTKCPKCDGIVIERSGFQVVDHSVGGSCRQCGQKISGIFL